MARYENEPRPKQAREVPREEISEIEEPKKTGRTHPAPYSGSVLPCSGGSSYERYTRKIGTLLIQKTRYHHHGHGTAEGGVERGKKRTENRGLGAVRKPRCPEGTVTVVIMEPERLMNGRMLQDSLSSRRFAMREALSDENIKWCEDESTGITSIVNIDEPKARQLCLDYGMSSYFFIEIGAEHSSFHTFYVKRSGTSLKKSREHRALDINPEDVFERIAAQLMIRMPDLKTAGIETKKMNSHER